MLLVSGWYSWSFMPVGCTANFFDCGSEKNSWIFQELRGTPQIFEFKMLLMSVALIFDLLGQWDILRYPAFEKPVQCVAKFLHCRSKENWIFWKLFETAQPIIFIMLYVFVAYPASLSYVRCLANFPFGGSLEKSIFQELPETAQTIGFIMIVVSVTSSAGFRLIGCVA